MNKIFTIGLFIIIFLGVSCNQDETAPLPEIMTRMVGSWQVDLGTLDFSKVDEWNETMMEISVLSNSSLKVMCFNQPKGRENIWPSESTLYLKQASNPIF